MHLFFFMLITSEIRWSVVSRVRRSVGMNFGSLGKLSFCNSSTGVYKVLSADRTCIIYISAANCTAPIIFRARATCCSLLFACLVLLIECPCVVFKPLDNAESSISDLSFYAHVSRLPLAKDAKQYREYIIVKHRHKFLAVLFISVKMQFMRLHGIFNGANASTLISCDNNDVKVTTEKLIPDTMSFASQ